jgi:starch phosphorylase
VQLVVAGKAHPADEEGKRFVQAWVAFVNRPDVRSRAVFLEDYDLALAQELVAGVDVWVNTPLRPWEACGTSGMKVLVNGGLNLSELDGWWAEAWEPGLGWALGAPDGHGDRPAEAEQLYRLLEEEVVASFYDRDAAGIPHAWLARIRASMARLTPRFSANRMIREYAERFYLPAAEAFRRRSSDGARLAGELDRWQSALEAHWREVRFIDVAVEPEEGGWRFEARIDSGQLPAAYLRAEVYADAAVGDPVRIPMERGEAIAGSANAYVWRTHLRGERPASDFTVRVVPYHPAAQLPAEDTHILWQH